LREPVLGDRLVVVGDQKQSIYRFQGADHTRFAAVTENLRARGGRVIALQDNRRCAPGIIRFVNALSAGGLFRDVLDYDPARDDLVARRPDRGVPCVWRLAGGTEGLGLDAKAMRYEEAGRIARLIAHLTAPAPDGFRVYDTDAPDDPGRPPRFGDVAVLFAKTSNLRMYAEALADAGIPYFTESGRGFWRGRAAIDAGNLLRTLQNPRDTAAGAALLRTPAFALTDEQWLEIGRRHDGFRLDRLAARLAGDDPPQVPAPVKTLLAVWQTLHRNKDRIALPELLDRWWSATGAYAAAAAGPQARQALANLRKLQQAARDFAAGRGGLADDPHRTLREFVDFLADEAGNLREGEAPVVGPNDDVVRLLTAHKSKGLEFRIVILADATGKADYVPGPSLQFSAAHGLVGKVWDAERNALVAGAAYKRWSDAEKRDVVRDQRKLLYVAATRARDLLVISGDYGKLNKNGTPRAVTCWRRWIEDTPAVQHVRVVGAESLLPLPAGGEHRLWPGPPPDPELAAPPPWPGTVTDEELSAAAEAVAATRPITLGKKGRGPVRKTVAELMELWAERHSVDDWTAEPDPGDAGDAAETGRLMHALLEQVDFARPPDAGQLARMAVNLGGDPARGPVRTAVEGLARFLIGRTAKRPAGLAAADVLRELPLSLEIARDDGRRVAVTGDADLLWRFGGQHTLLDFKNTPAGRPELYAFQLRLYAAALAKRGLVVGEGFVLFLAEPDPDRAEQRVALADLSLRAVEDEVLALLWEE
jgi:ATP-dependent exoDNAse (exonuclease V) beta subunit